MVENKHRILREVLRNYVTLKKDAEESGYSLTICAIKGCINSTGARKGHDGPCELVTVNFIDLQNCLSKLSKRKKEAVFYNVILDMKQKDVAARMGITTVSVGQYVEQAMLQIVGILWPEDDAG